jgi:hypothetical protein
MWDENLQGLNELLEKTAFFQGGQGPLKKID